MIYYQINTFLGDHLVIFCKDQRVFSLSGTSDVVLYGDLKSLWSEFFCYLLIAGLFKEGESVNSLTRTDNFISNKEFSLYNNSYNYKLGSLIAKGLHDRYMAIKSNPYTNENEKSLLDELNGLFCPEDRTYINLSASRLFGVALARQLDADMVTIARYVSVMYGQHSFPNDTYLNKLYISLFGNIHLVNEKYEDKIKVTEPIIKYGQVINKGCAVSPMFAMLSSMVSGYSELNNGGQVFIGDLSGYLFLSKSDIWESSVPLPKAVSAANVAIKTGVDGSSTFSLVGNFYHSFLYGSLSDIDIIRHSVFLFILHHMVKMMGESHHNYIIPPTSIYRKIINNSTISGGFNAKRSVLLSYALEALEPNPKSPDSEEKDSSASSKEDEDIPSDEDDPETDPSTEDGGYDPGTPPPAVPTAVPRMAKDTIELISFDKTGEGVEEDLYRTAVVVLNNRIKEDDSVEVSADIKDSLNQWVNGYLYRSAISATKDRIKALKLEKYLKTFN